MELCLLAGLGIYKYYHHYYPGPYLYFCGAGMDYFYDLRSIRLVPDIQFGCFSRILLVRRVPGKAVY